MNFIKLILIISIISSCSKYKEISLSKGKPISETISKIKNHGWVEIIIHHELSVEEKKLNGKAHTYAHLKMKGDDYTCLKLIAIPEDGKMVLYKVYNFFNEAIHQNTITFELEK